jgi:outer membrane lipoprotein SlyB
LNSQSSHKQTRSIVAAIATALMVLSVVTGCSPKPSADESAAQTKVMVDQAVAEAKKEMLAEQAASKDKQDAIAAAQAEAKNKQDAAVALAVENARKDFDAEQRASAAKVKKERLAEQRAKEAKARQHNNSSNQTSVSTNSCSRCGVVISVNEIEAEGAGSGLGVVAGGVVGGVLGHQIGGGSGRDLATVAGAVGGAFAGNKIEKISKKTRSYNIVVRMDTGEERTFRQASVPEVVRGDKVKVENGEIVRR